MVHIKLFKQGRYLVCERSDDRSQVKYDLAKKQLLRPDNNGVWGAVQHQYSFFKGCTLKSLQTEDEKFEKLLYKVKEANPDCKSISTFLTKIDSFLHLEAYIMEGVKYEFYVTTGYGWDYKSTEVGMIDVPLHYFDKHLIEFAKEYNIEFDRTLRSCYDERKDEMLRLIHFLTNSDYEKYTVRGIWYDCYGGSGHRALWELVDEHGYCIKALVNYVHNYLIPFEGFDTSWRGSVYSTLRDYYSMAKDIGRKVQKYPKYLRSMHDIILANHKVFKQRHDEEMFAKRQRQELRYTDKEYTVLLPESSKDVISEGTSLNHCVGSYVKRIIEGRCLILFLRKSKEQEDSLVTLEVVGDKLVQAKGAYNRGLEKEEADFLAKWCRIKKLKAEVTGVKP